MTGAIGGPYLPPIVPHDRSSNGSFIMKQSSVHQMFAPSISANGAVDNEKIYESQTSQLTLSQYNGGVPPQKSILKRVQHQESFFGQPASSNALGSD